MNHISTNNQRNKRGAILFVLLPSVSHFFMSFGIARQLQSLGYEIWFTINNKKLEEVVTKNGFKYVYLIYLDQYKIRTIMEGLRYLLYNLLTKKLIIKIHKNFLSNLSSYLKIISSINPKYVFVDDMLAHYLEFQPDSLQTRYCIFNARLSCSAQDNIPPLISGYLPNRSFPSRVICTFLWHKHLMWRKLVYLSRYICFRGVTISSQTQKVIKSHSIRSFDQNINRRYSFNNIRNNFPIAVIGPYQLDYPWFKEPLLEFTITLPIERNENMLLNGSVDKFLLELDIKIKTFSKIVYCALGTFVQNVKKGMAKLFYERIVSLAQIMPEVYFIISVSESSNRKYLNSIGLKNLMAYEFLPQLTLIKKTDLVIFHGGTNTLTECIQFGVPMLAYPIHDLVDHFGNSARIAYHKIGIFGKIKRESIKTTSKAVIELLNNPFYKANIEKLRQQIFCSSQSPKNSVKSLLGFIDINQPSVQQSLANVSISENLP